MASIDIAGYTYQADIYGRCCIVSAVTSSPAYDGWALGEGIVMPVEQNLDEIAAHFQIDRQDEHTFDSGDFPKVVFEDMLSGSERCATCHEDLV